MKKLISLLLIAVLLLTASIPAIATDTSEAALTAEDIINQSMETMRQLDSFKAEGNYIVNKDGTNVEIQRLFERNKTNHSLHGQTIKDGEKIRETYIQGDYIYRLSRKTGEFVKAKINRYRERFFQRAFNPRDHLEDISHTAAFVLDSEQTDDTHYVIHVEGELQENITTVLEGKGFELPDELEIEAHYTFYVQKETHYLDRVEVTINGSTEEEKTATVSGAITLEGFNQTEITVPEDVLNADTINHKQIKAKIIQVKIKIKHWFNF
ncbi:MAG: hypothetical protein XD91_1569 [Clostridiales bacterium 38_11]|nr:MAG: hypothetical protein XD91_1569 [Clostridiales bacterium 38_11]